MYKIDQDEQAAVRRHDAEEFGQRPVLVSIVVKRFDRKNLVEEVFFPGNLLRRSPNVQNIFKVFRGRPRLADHFVGNIETHHLPETFRSFSHQT